MKQSMVLILAVVLLIAVPSRADDATRRQAISDKGKSLFKNTKNHCHALRDLTSFAIEQSKDTVLVLEDLKLVLIGEGLRNRGTGKYYIGNTSGARGDSGFKKELRDGSPQAEHAFAAIYIGKMGPGAGELAALLTEVMGPLESGGKLNAADILLYSFASDIGQRMANKNLADVPKVIERTLCE